METVAARTTRAPWRAAAIAAAVSVVTMPLTAVWFLLLGGVLVVAAAASAAVTRAPALSPIGFVGLGLLAGPAVYLALAAAQ